MRLLLTVCNATDILVTEDSILVEVSKTTSLFNQGRGKTVCVSLVVDELRVDIVVDL